MNSCALGSVGFTDFERRRRSAHRLPKILFRTCRPPMRQDQHRCRHSNVASCICMLHALGFHVACAVARNTAAMVQAETMCMLSLPQRLSHVAKAILAYSHWYVLESTRTGTYSGVLALVRTREYSHWYVFEITAVVRTVFIPQDLRGGSLSMLSRQRKSNPTVRQCSGRAPIRSIRSNRSNRSIGYSCGVEPLAVTLERTDGLCIDPSIGVTESLTHSVHCAALRLVRTLPVTSQDCGPTGGL